MNTTTEKYGSVAMVSLKKGDVFVFVDGPLRHNDILYEEPVWIAVEDAVPHNPMIAAVQATQVGYIKHRNLIADTKE